MIRGGQLFEILNETGPFDEPVARFIFHQLIDILEYLSSLGISHSKINLENILLDENYNIRLRNFHKATTHATCMSSCLSGSYCAPEVISNHKYNCHISDIFSAGVVLFTLVSQANPFFKADAKDSYYKLISNNRPDLFWKVFERNKNDINYYSKEFKQLINWMLACDPHERPSLSEIKESEWYNGKTPSSSDIIEEFNRRKEQIAQKNMQASQNAPNYLNSPVYNSFPSVSRSISDELEESKDIFTSIENLEEKEYIPECTRYTKFFSTSPLNQLVGTLLDFGEKQAKSLVVSNSELQIKLKFADSKEENVDVIVNILKHGDKHCFEVLLKFNLTINISLPNSNH